LMMTLGALFFTSFVGQAQAQHKDKKHKIVFDVSVGGEEAWQGVLNNVENVQKSFGQGNSQIEVVLHGKGLGLILKTNTNQQERLKMLSGKGIVFAACENTMKRMNVTREQLLPFAVTVDSGVAEVVRKQEAGWTYIKAGS
jgi:intracellular sulfur oxidation DsrE/DsrF family protein